MINMFFCYVKKSDKIWPNAGTSEYAAVLIVNISKYLIISDDLSAADNQQERLEVNY